MSVIATTESTAWSPTDALLGFVDTWRGTPLPRDVHQRAKQVVLDTLACYVGATGLASGRVLKAFAEESTGSLELFPFSSGVSPDAAAFVSASLTNLLDADDTFYNRAHICAPMVVPTLILGSLHGRSLRDAVRAIAIAYEVTARIALSCAARYYTVEGNKVRSAAVAGFSWVAPGAALALGLIRGLDEAALRSAFGVAAYGAPVPTNSNWHVDYPPESMTKYCHYAAAAQSAMSAVALAAHGFVGPGRVFDGPHGFRRLIGAVDWDDTAIRDGIPGRWAVSETSLKRYPACRLWHGALYGLELLASQHDVAVEQIKSVDVKLGMLNPMQVRLATEQPSLTEISAQFSVPYDAAQVLERRTPGPAWYRPEQLRSERTMSLMKRIHVSVDPELNSQMAEEVKRVGHFGFRTTWAVAITLDSGRVLTQSGGNAPGDPFIPELNTPFDETKAKFRQYYEQARRAAPSDQAQQTLLDDNATCAEVLAALQ